MEKTVVLYSADGRIKSEVVMDTYPGEPDAVLETRALRFLERRLRSLSTDMPHSAQNDL